MNTVHGADFDTRGVLYVYAGLNDDVCHVPQGYHAPVNARV
jgi:5-deoxy-D-glucuronate isomerase